VSCRSFALKPKCIRQLFQHSFLDSCFDFSYLHCSPIPRDICLAFLHFSASFSEFYCEQSNATSANTPARDLIFMPFILPLSQAHFRNIRQFTLSLAPKTNTPWSVVQPSSINAPEGAALAPQLHESEEFPAQNAARADIEPCASTSKEEEGERPWSNAPNICSEWGGGEDETHRMQTQCTNRRHLACDPTVAATERVRAVSGGHTTRHQLTIEGWQGDSGLFCCKSSCSACSEPYA